MVMMNPMVLDGFETLITSIEQFGIGNTEEIAQAVFANINAKDLIGECQQIVMPEWMYAEMEFEDNRYIPGAYFEDNATIEFHYTKWVGDLDALPRRYVAITTNVNVKAGITLTDEKNSFDCAGFCTKVTDGTLERGTTTVPTKVVTLRAQEWVRPSGASDADAVRKISIPMDKDVIGGVDVRLARRTNLGI